MATYNLTFSAATVSVQQDLFEIVAPAAGTIRIIGMVLGQTSDYGDAAAEGLQLQLIRGHTTSGSGGSAFTPVLANTRQNASSATCEINNTTIATLGTTTVLYADAWNIQGGHQMWFPPEAMLFIRNSERLVLRQSAPNDALTQAGTLYFEEE